MAECLPSIAEMMDLHRKYAPTEQAFELVWVHSQIVGDIALQLAEMSEADIDKDLVRVGSTLHDVGVYKLFKQNGVELEPKNYIRHGILGEEILRDEGFSEQICRFASHHTGAGLTKQQIIERGLPLPHQDFLAETIEEELVMYADKFHSKAQPPCFNSYEHYADYVTRFGPKSVKSFARLTFSFGKPDLEPLISAYGHRLLTK